MDLVESVHDEKAESPLLCERVERGSWGWSAWSREGFGYLKGASGKDGNNIFSRPWPVPE